MEYTEAARLQNKMNLIVHVCKMLSSLQCSD